MSDRKVKNLTIATPTTAISVREASKRLNIEMSVMRNYLYEGRFTTLKYQGYTFIDPKEVENWKQHHQR
jgi:hypothetical protein